MRTIVDLVAWLAQQRAAEQHLQVKEREQLAKLLSHPHDNLPYLDRIEGVWRGCPLILEREAFNDLCDTLRQRLDMPDLAAQLERSAERHGGLISRQEALSRYALIEKKTACVH